MIISIDAENVFDRIQHLFTINALTKGRIQKNIHKHNEAIYERPTANIILKGEKLKALLLKSIKR